jgi:hypothetical protein
MNNERAREPVYDDRYVEMCRVPACGFCTPIMKSVLPSMKCIPWMRQHRFVMIDAIDNHPERIYDMEAVRRAFRDIEALLALDAL